MDVHEVRCLYNSSTGKILQKKYQSKWLEDIIFDNNESISSLPHEHVVDIFPSFFRSWWDRIWQHKPTMMVCCLLFMAFVITSFIVLSLIPLYLPMKELNGIDINGSMSILLLFIFHLYWIVVFQTRLPLISSTELM